MDSISERFIQYFHESIKNFDEETILKETLKKENQKKPIIRGEALSRRI
jgi:hypothetical protein